MAKVNISLPQMDIDQLTDSQAIKRIMSYLYQLNEQLRYELTHIDENNISQSSGDQTPQLTQAAVEKTVSESIDEAVQGLASEESVKSLSREMENLLRLIQSNSASIRRNTDALNGKASTAMVTAMGSSLTELINNINTALGKKASKALFELLSENYYAHKHSISISSSGVISMGGPTATASNPNISATDYFKNAVAGVHVTGVTRGNFTETDEQGVVSRYYPITVRLSNTGVNSSYDSSIDAETAYQAGRDSVGSPTVTIESVNAVASYSPAIGQSVMVYYRVNGGSLRSAPKTVIYAGED